MFEKADNWKEWSMIIISSISLATVVMFVASLLLDFKMLGSIIGILLWNCVFGFIIRPTKIPRKKSRNEKMNDLFFGDKNLRKETKKSPEKILVDELKDNPL